MDARAAGPWRRLLFWDAGFFTDKSDKDLFVLAVLGVVCLTPFGVVSFMHGRHGLGAVTLAVVGWFLLNGAALYRGRRLMPAEIAFLPILGALGAALALRGEVGIFWAFPAILLFHFILERRVANLFNTSIVVMAAPFAYGAFGADVAARVVVTLALTIMFANVFSYLADKQLRIQAEQERMLGLERDRLALLVHATQAGFTDWDAAGDPAARSVVYSERFKEMLGHPRDADTSRWPYFFEMMHADDRPAVEAEFRAMLRQKRSPGLQQPGQALDYRLRRADGSYIWVHAESLAQVDETLRIRRFITSYQDISKFRAQEARLRESVRLREEVERMSRHDLKTPLNGVIALSSLLRESGRLGADDAQLLGTIERAGYRVLNMVNLSLDLFRMEQGSYQFVPRAVDLAGVARRAAADLEAQAASKNINIQIKSKDQPVARADELLCYSMFANLVKNAIEAAPEGSVVSLLLEVQEDWVIARVHNPGAVPGEMRGRVFEKYATAGKSAGLGLGTYSARLMARVQGGDIRLRSSEAHGTSLIVRLRSWECAGSSLEMRAALEPGGEARLAQRAALPPLRVLVADDDEFNRMVMRRYLPSPPLEVELAVNGRAALDAAERAWPDAVLLDLEMPVMSGYETARRLREIESTRGRKRCRIVAVSSNDEPASIERALAAGCDHYLAKPATREALWRLLGGHAAAAAFSVAPSSSEKKETKPSDPVLVDADLRPSLPAFLASRREALERLEAALAAGQRAAAREITHTLAGSFSLYGFRWAAARCRAIRRVALEGEARALAAQAAAVRRHLDSAELRFIEAALPAE